MRERRELARLWSIPAWAGETGAVFLPMTFPPVYPRVGGGNPFPFLPHLLGSGLSPRGRGKQG